MSVPLLEENVWHCSVKIAKPSPGFNAWRVDQALWPNNSYKSWHYGSMRNRAACWPRSISQEIKTRWPISPRGHLEAHQIGILIQKQLTHIFQSNVPTPTPELLERITAHLCNSYTHDFHLADHAFQAGRLEATSRSCQKYWDHWQAYAGLLGADPYTQDTSFSTQMQVLSGFMAWVYTGFFGQGKQVKHCTVSSALTAVSQVNALACNSNPTKINGSEKLLPRLQIMLDGHKKEGRQQ